MQDTNDLISVIVPIYKVEKYLDECISSIVNQTYRNMQIILVDDGSPDRCGEICDEWAKRDSRIMVIHKSNGGLSDARNAGIDVAIGEFIVFIDSDDWVESTMLEVMHNLLQKEQADFVACGIVDCYPDKKIVHSMPYTVGGSELFLERIYKDTVFPISAWNKLYRRECWKELRFPKGKLCEDAFTTYLLVDKARKIVQIPNALYNYRIRESSIMTTVFRPERMDEEEAWRENYLYMKQKYPKIGKIAYDFYLQKVNILFHTIQEEQYSLYPEEHDYLYHILRSNLIYVIFRSSLNWKYRVTYLLDVLRIK